MLDYSHTWEGQPQEVKTTDLDTNIILMMLDAIDTGEPVDYEGQDPQGVRERLKLELEIRAWGF